MALTDNRIQLQDCEASADVAGDSTADPQATTSEAGFVIEGANAVSFQVTNAQEYIAFDQDSAGSTFNIDMSDVTAYIAVKDNLLDAFASLGGQIVFNDGADGGGGDCIGYNAGGSDAVGLPYDKRYHFFKLDVSVVVAAPGTDNVDFFTYNGVEANLDHTAVLQVGYGSIHLAKAVGTTANGWFGGIYYIANDGFAATISGGTSGTPETMVDLVGDDATVGAGMFANPVGSTYYIFAPTEWGDSGTATTAFAGTDEAWIYLGDNGGGHVIGDTHFPMQLVGNATGTNIFRQTRVTNTNTGSRAAFDWSDADFDEIALEATTWIDFGVITAPGVDVDKNANNTTFNNCDQFIMNAMNMDTATFNGAFNADGAVLLDTSGDSNNAVDLTFVSDGTGHAVEISVAGTYDFDNWTFSGYGADGTTDAEVFISANVAVTINIQNGGDSPTVRHSGTAPTIVNAVTLRGEGVTEGTAVVIVAAETLGTITRGDTIFEGFADSDGVAETTNFNYESAFGAGLAVDVKARNSGIATAAIAGDNFLFIDETTEAANATDNDMNLLPVAPTALSNYNFGYQDTFGQLKLWITDVNGPGSTIVWSYCNGTSLVPLSNVVDGTNNFENSGLNTVSWDIPGDWVQETLDGIGPFFYVVALLTAIGSASQTRARQCTLDVTRYLAFPQTGVARRTITSAGLVVNIPWTEDTIGKF